MLSFVLLQGSTIYILFNQWSLLMNHSVGVVMKISLFWFVVLKPTNGVGNITQNMGYRNLDAIKNSTNLIISTKLVFKLKLLHSAACIHQVSNNTGIAKKLPLSSSMVYHQVSKLASIQETRNKIIFLKELKHRTIPCVHLCVYLASVLFPPITILDCALQYQKHVLVVAFGCCRSRC